MDTSQSLGRRQNAAHLDSTTIVEASCPLSLRGTSGERAGERGTFHRIGAANWNPLSLTLSPLLCRGERESTSGMVVVLRCTLTRPTLLEDCLTFSVNQPNFMARLNTRRVVAARFSLRKAQAGCAS